MEIADWMAWVQIVSSVVLVVVTAAYVILTWRVAQITSTATRAAQESALEMREQRLRAIQPVLIGRLGIQSIYDDVPHIVFVSVVNVGTGSGLSVQCSLMIGNVRYTAIDAIKASIEVLKSGEDREIGEFSASVHELRSEVARRAAVGHLTIEYFDVYERKFESRLLVSISNSGHLVAMAPVSVQQLQDMVERH